MTGCASYAMVLRGGVSVSLPSDQPKRMADAPTRALTKTNAPAGAGSDRGSFQPDGSGRDRASA